jgi:hypothetical protein
MQLQRMAGALLSERRRSFGPRPSVISFFIVRIMAAG